MYLFTHYVYDKIHLAFCYTNFLELKYQYKAFTCYVMYSEIATFICFENTLVQKNIYTKHC